MDRPEREIADETEDARPAGQFGVERVLSAGMGFFRLSRGKGAKLAEPPQVFAFTFRLAGDEAALPPPITGAWVIAYVLGSDAASAAQGATKALLAIGYMVEEMAANGHAFPITAWSAHISKVWPDYETDFPDQSSILAVLSAGEVVLSPLIGFHDET